MEIANLLKQGLLAGAIAAGVNGIIYLIAKSSGIISTTVLPPYGKPLGMAAVVLSSAIPAIPAALLLFSLAKFTSDPITIFTVISLLLLLFSLGGPFGVPGLPFRARMTLALMHLVARSVTIYT
jgi:hypothetical protein